MHSGEVGLRSRSSGFAWLMVLAMLAMASAGASVVAARWADERAREREQELLRIGDLYAEALADFKASSPGGERAYPKSLDLLLEDLRFAGTRRHLRTLYPNPLSGRLDWELVRGVDGGITGIRPPQSGEPWRRTPVALPHCDLPVAHHYRDWVFAARESISHPRIQGS